MRLLPLLVLLAAPAQAGPIHFVKTHAPDARERHTQAKVVLGMLTTPIVIDEFFNVRSNVRTAERLEERK